MENDSYFTIPATNAGKVVRVFVDFSNLLPAKKDHGSRVRRQLFGAVTRIRAKGSAKVYLFKRSVDLLT